MDDNITRRIYEIRFLNDDLAKSNDDRMLGTDVRIAPSGAIELNQVFTDTETTHKVFYSGQYFIKEMPMEEYLELKKESPHEHDHGDAEDSD